MTDECIRVRNSENTITSNIFFDFIAKPDVRDDKLREEKIEAFVGWQPLGLVLLQFYIRTAHKFQYWLI